MRDGFLNFIPLGGIFLVMPVSTDLFYTIIVFENAAVAIYANLTICFLNMGVT